MHLKKFLAFSVLWLCCFNCERPNTKLETATLIPQPNFIEKQSSFFEINNTAGISFSSDFAISARFLKSFIENGSAIELDEGDNIRFIKDESLPNEAYKLSVSDSEIEIRALSDRGAFYAVQTLRQLMPVELEDMGSTISEIRIRTLRIEDEPRFLYRGMHLDVGRHMYSVGFIKKYIDALAMLKMNTFHWHLTEDQGWRIEIKKYPKLQEVAAYRDETLIGHYSDQPHKFDGKKYGGFYTQEEIKEIVAYAQDRFVTIIPEIEMPGHSQAAIAAYPELGCTGEQAEVATKWGVFEEVYCPSEKTFEFLEDVIDEVVALFPGKYIHIGGDEAPKTRWKNCSYCQELIKEKGLKDEHGLQSYFIERMERYINSKGKQIIGWDEILEGGLAPNATVMSWRGTSGAIEAAKAGHNVIMTPTSHCYFDYYQSEDENEPLAIGGFLPLEKVYNFNPIPSELTKEEAKFVLGAQGNVWTEYMPSAEQVEYMAFPRMLAISEVLWSNSEQRNFNAFVKRLESFHQRLDALDINYANHLYEIEGDVVTKNGNLFYELKTFTKGKSIRYTTDGSEPDSSSRSYDSIIPIFETMAINAAVFHNKIQLGKTFSQDINFHKAVGAEITIDKTPHRAYSGSGAQGLINGISGSDKRYGDKEWLGFWGEDIEITIDLGEEEEINSIETRFFSGEGQWIYNPKTVSFDLLDSEYSSLFNNKPIPTIILLKTKNTYLASVDFDGFKPRVIKIYVKNYGTIPVGKQGAGNKAWTFIDEIIVN